MRFSATPIEALDPACEDEETALDRIRVGGAADAFILGVVEGLVAGVFSAYRLARPSAIVYMTKATEAEWRLAEYLYFTMVKLDPSPDDQEWEQLTDKERRFYWDCIRAVLSRRKNVEAALLSGQLRQQRRDRLGCPTKPTGAI